MLERGRIYATIVIRSLAGWGSALAEPGGVLAMRGTGIEVSMADLYDGLTFPPEGTGQEAGVQGR